MLVLHEKSETRTRKHHQPRPKTLRNNAYPKHHVQAPTTPFAVRTVKKRQDFWSNFVIVSSTFESDHPDDFWIGIRKMSKNHRNDQSRKSNLQIPTKQTDWSQRSEEAWGAIIHKTRKTTSSSTIRATSVTGKRWRSKCTEKTSCISFLINQVC